MGIPKNPPIHSTTTIQNKLKSLSVNITAKGKREDARVV